MPFTTMRHGFLTRGNMEDPEVAAEVLFSSIFGLSRRNMFAQIVAGVNFLSQCFWTSGFTQPSGVKGYERYCGLPREALWTTIDKRCLCRR